MFEYFNFDMLFMIKLFYDHTGLWYKTSLYDYQDGINYDLFNDMLQYVFDYIDFDSADNFDMLVEIYDSVITEFYDLCKEYSRRKHIAFYKNPFVKAFRGKSHVLFREGDVLSDDRGHKIELIIDEADSFDFVSMLDNFFVIKEFIQQKNKELKVKLCPTTGQSDLTEERRAA